MIVKPYERYSLQSIWLCPSMALRYPWYLWVLPFRYPLALGFVVHPLGRRGDIVLGWWNSGDEDDDAKDDSVKIGRCWCTLTPQPQHALHEAPCWSRPRRAERFDEYIYSKMTSHFKSLPGADYIGYIIGRLLISLLFSLPLPISRFLYDIIVMWALGFVFRVIALFLLYKVIKVSVCPYFKTIVKVAYKTNFTEWACKISSESSGYDEIPNYDSQ